MPGTGKIITISVDPALVEKELHEAATDLAAAERSLADHNEKWAIIQAYYSQFHSLRSMVLGKGYREKSHRCLKYAVEALLIDEGILDPKILEHFSFSMDLREGADYGCIYSDGFSLVLLWPLPERYLKRSQNEKG